MSILRSGWMRQFKHMSLSNPYITSGLRHLKPPQATTDLVTIDIVW